MTDVRLTATNPEDSSVVPVACNAKGELLLEEPTVSSDKYVAKAGDTMTGNLHLGDNITLDATDGSAEFVSNGFQIQESYFAANNGGNLYFRIGRLEQGNHPLLRLQTRNVDNANAYSDIKLDGSITSLDPNSSSGVSVLRLGVGSSGSNILSNCVAVDSAGNFGVGTSDNGTSGILLKADGSAEFISDVVIGSRNKQWMIVESNGLAHLVEQTRADLVDVESSIDYPPLRDIPSELTMVEEQLQKVLEKLRMVPEAGWEVWDGSDEN